MLIHGFHSVAEAEVPNPRSILEWGRSAVAEGCVWGFEVRTTECFFLVEDLHSLNLT